MIFSRSGGKLKHWLNSGTSLYNHNKTQKIKYSYSSNFHHQPGDFFRTDLLWHSTAADGLLQGGNDTVPTSVVFAPASPPPCKWCPRRLSYKWDICYLPSSLFKFQTSPEKVTWLVMKIWQSQNILLPWVLFTFMIMNLYQTNKLLQEHFTLLRTWQYVQALCGSYVSAPHDVW